MTWRPNENECLTVIHRAREKLSVKSASPESLHHTLPYFSSVGTKRYTKFVLPKHYKMLNLTYTQYNIHIYKLLHTACFKIGRQSLKKWNWVGDAQRGKFRRPKSSFSLQPMLGLQMWKNIFKFPKWKWVGEAPEKRLQASAIFISSAQAPRGHSTTNQLSEVRYRFAHLPFLLFLQPHSIVFNGWPWVFAQVGSIQKRREVLTLTCKGRRVQVFSFLGQGEAGSHHLKVFLPSWLDLENYFLFAYVKILMVIFRLCEHIGIVLP